MPSVFGISVQGVPGFLRPSRQTSRCLRDTSPRESITILRGNKLGGSFDITKTCLYNVDPLQPHFYIAKLGFTGIYINFLISAQKHRLWVLVRTALPRRFLTSTHNLCFEQKFEKKYKNFYLKIFIFLVVKFSVYLNRLVFVMKCLLGKPFL